MNRFCKGAAAAMAIGLTSGGCASGADAQIVAGPTGPHHTRDDTPLFMPDPQELNSATLSQIRTVREAAEKYRDIAEAEREGWQPLGKAAPLVGQHWAPPAAMERTGMARQGLLDFARPNRLVYTQIDGKMVLAAAGFAVALAQGDALPAGFSGEADRWRVVGGEGGTQNMAMLHVWIGLPNPDGPFAWHNRSLPLLRHGLGADALDTLTPGAALGLELAAPSACGRMLADTAAPEMRAACDQAAARIRTVISNERGNIPAILSSAQSAWSDFAGRYPSALTANDADRIAPLTPDRMEEDHDDGHKSGPER